MARPPISKARPWTPTRGRFAGRTFVTERAYRDALAEAKGHGNWYHEQRAAKKVTPKNLGELRPSQKQARARALEALSKVRRGATLTRAAKEAGTTPNTVARYAGEQLHRERGRTVASTSDRLVRVMNVITVNGVEEGVTLRSSRQASLVGEHANAVKHFLATGDDEPLRKFKGVKVAGRELETRPEMLEELGRTGELEYEPYDD